MKSHIKLTLFLIFVSAIQAFAGGPTPVPQIDTANIVDEAVTILKTDGIAADDFSNVTPATGRTALGLDLRLDTINASFTGDIDVAGDVGAATLNGVTIATGSYISIRSNYGQMELSYIVPAATTATLKTLLGATDLRGRLTIVNAEAGTYGDFQVITGTNTVARTVAGGISIASGAATNLNIYAEDNDVKIQNTFPAAIRPITIRFEGKIVR